MCACTAVLDQHIYMCGYTYVDECTLPGCCTKRPTAMFLGDCSWKLSLFRANGVILRSTSNLILVTSLYVRTRNCVTTALVNGPPYWYVIPPHICYQYEPVYILIQTNT